MDSLCFNLGSPFLGYNTFSRLWNIFSNNLPRKGAYGVKFWGILGPTVDLILVVDWKLPSEFQVISIAFQRPWSYLWNLFFLCLEALEFSLCLNLVKFCHFILWCRFVFIQLHWTLCAQFPLQFGNLFPAIQEFFLNQFWL
jgi:hypothetical protein